MKPRSALLIGCLGLITLNLSSGKSSSALHRPSRTSVGPVVATGGALYMGGRYLSPPYTISYMNDVLVVNGYRVRPDRRRMCSNTQNSPKQQLSLRAAARAQEAREEGLSEGAVLERVAHTYQESPLVQAVVVDSLSLRVTFKDRPDRPRHILLSRRLSEFPTTAQDRNAKGIHRRTRDINALKQMLDDGALILITPSGRLTVPKQKALIARETIEKFKRAESVPELSTFVPADMWGYLREPAIEPAQ
jgi:hypothetical protein